MKYFRGTILLFVLFFVFIYTVSIDNIPKNIQIFRGEEVKIATLWGVDITRDETIQASSNLATNIFNEPGEQQLNVSLFEKIKLKTINVKVLEDIEVIPVGEVVGMKLYTNGILVVGTSAIEGIDGQMHKPFENTEMQEGDSIIKLNDITINNTDELMNEINKTKDKEIKITYIHEQETKEAQITPVETKDGDFKIGLWVRDSAAGVGTITFYNEDTESFAALGHPITDIDTGEIINTSSGEIDGVKIVSIVKGEKEDPGRLEGSIVSDKVIGSIYNNTKFGVYGIIKDLKNINIDFNRRMKVASRREIKQGAATCLCNVDGEVKEYNIDISQIYINNNYDNKSMVVKVTDEDLISKTGGIVQGMSGSPIIQNGKFVGAITHVLVNDPKVGYAVFADLMLK